jgi:hypothetical protein
MIIKANPIKTLPVGTNVVIDSTAEALQTKGLLACCIAAAFLVFILCCITWVRPMSYLDWEKTSLFCINKSSTRLCSSGVKLALHLSMVSLKTEISGCWVLKGNLSSYGERFIPFAPH